MTRLAVRPRRAPAIAAWLGVVMLYAIAFTACVATPAGAAQTVDHDPIQTASRDPS